MMMYTHFIAIKDHTIDANYNTQNNIKMPRGTPKDMLSWSFVNSPISELSVVEDIMLASVVTICIS